MNRFEALLKKYHHNQCTPEELEELLDYFGSGLNADEIKEALEQQMDEAGVPTTGLEAETSEIYERIRQRINTSEHRSGVKFYRWWWAAAVIFFCCSLLSYYLISYNRQATVADQVARAHIVPGGNRAVLTLANGKTILLTTSPDGKLAQEGDVAIQKTQEGQIVYTSAANEGKSAATAGINRLTTPRGGIYDVVLSDGSHVWLNSASTLSYPAAFTGAERQVELTGEAYFEIAHNGKPFKVISRGQTVQVLGTHFNIEAYADEPAIKTTLLQGSVKLSCQDQQILLKPGEMGINDLRGGLHIKPADIDEVMAWKNGVFIFNNESIVEVMRKAARWYDVEVEYDSNVENKKLWGTVSRYKTINELLDNIAIAGKLSYKIEGRRVIIMR